ncbi:hypothetical protein ILYODFUR_038432 [Ilyodon furcidens]|uniref:Uncharacterized protein n=1 Tax=Ilyodon furcidens TaxID=33524 RepID=A0ABV0U166_9TELE
MQSSKIIALGNLKQLISHASSCASPASTNPQKKNAPSNLFHSGCPPAVPKLPSFHNYAAIYRRVVVSLSTLGIIKSDLFEMLLSAQTDAHFHPQVTETEELSQFLSD